MSSHLALAADNGLAVSNAWIRMAPPVLKTHGGYFTITNQGHHAKELVEASSPNYEAVELHVSRVENGVATMQRLESIEIPAGGKIEFKPGGMHLMLLSAKKPLAPGAMVPIQLGFRDGSELTVKAMVMKDAPEGASQMKEMDHSEHGGHKHTN
jgi:copper(I)-binding protein